MKIIYISTILISLAIFIFTISLHNIDLAFNNKFGMLDFNAFGFVKTNEELYFIGFQGLIVALIFFLISFYLLLFRRIISIQYRNL